MFFKPIQSINGIQELNISDIQENLNIKKNDGVFGGMVKNAINSLNETNTAVEQNLIDIASGEMDNLHQVTMDAAMAQMTTSLVVQLRDRALESYNEIMKINL